MGFDTSSWMEMENESVVLLAWCAHHWIFHCQGHCQVSKCIIPLQRNLRLLRRSYSQSEG